MASRSQYVEKLEKKLGADWKHLRAARERSTAKSAAIGAAVSGLDSADTSIVISGSLARDEYTDSSDIDWSLLIDGTADPEHYELCHQIETRLRDLAPKPPGPEGTFGAMVFSHDLIHAIGGQEDTNKNTTRRILLLLESLAVGREEASDGVVRKILNRYLLEDRGLWHGSGPRLPRFLLNDIARFWRTMAVDFAYKRRQRFSQGWAIRTIKLRMSRKLIYVSGLLVCYECALGVNDKFWRDSQWKKALIVWLQSKFLATPLETLAETLLRCEHLKETAWKLFEAYDGFIGILADSEKRNRLDDLKEDDADGDDVYQEARALSHDFRDGLEELFFDSESGMDKLTKRYGVF